MKRKILFSIVSAIAVCGTLLGPVADAEAGRCHRRARCGHRCHRSTTCAPASCSPCGSGCEVAPEAAPVAPEAAPAAPAAPPAPAPAA